MTDQPDTAAIRALLAVGIYVDYHDGLALCDALDAARAERDEVREERNWLSRGDLNHTMGAYRAHREVDDAMRRRAEAERDVYVSAHTVLVERHRLLGVERDRLETLYGFQVGRADLEKARAEAAEARIADAMEEHAPRSTYGTGPADSLHPDDRMCRRCKAVYPCATVRALTGGTA